jgi:hypothetical protein
VVGFLSGLVLGQDGGQPADSKSSADRIEQTTLASSSIRKSKVAPDISKHWIISLHGSMTNVSHSIQVQL